MKSWFHRSSRPVTKEAPSAIPNLTRSDRRVLFWLAVLRIFLVLAGVAAVLYLAAQLVARTEWMRHRLESELSKLSGMPVRIDGRVRATEALNLRARDVISFEGDSGLSVGILRIRWRLFPPQGESHVESVWAENVRLTLTIGEDGTLRPAFLGACGRQAASYLGIPTFSHGTEEEATGGEATIAGLADLSAADGAKRTPRKLSVVPLLRVQNATVRWLDAKGEMLASASGIDMTWRTLALPEIGMNPVLSPDDAWSVSHLRGYAASVSVPPSIHIAGLRLELIHAGDRQFLSHLSADDWGKHPPPRDPAARTPDVEMLLDEKTFQID